jgi:hypothetical protein
MFLLPIIASVLVVAVMIGLAYWLRGAGRND